MPPIDNTLLNDISSKLSALIANSPLQDVEKNMKTVLSSAFSSFSFFGITFLFPYTIEANKN